jgi:hypothetical protein
MRKSSFLTAVLLVFTFYSAVSAVNDTIKNKAGKKNIAFNMTAGTSFMTGINNFSALNTYIAPVFSTPLSKKFILDGGFAIVNTNINPMFVKGNDLQNTAFSNNFTSTFIFAGGKYLLNERFTISGHAYTEVYSLNSNFNQKKVLNNNIKGAVLGVDYKISESSTLGIQLNFSNGNNYFYNNAFSLPSQNPYFIGQ